MFYKFKITFGKSNIKINIFKDKYFQFSRYNAYTFNSNTKKPFRKSQDFLLWFLCSRYYFIIDVSKIQSVLKLLWPIEEVFF